MPIFTVNLNGEDVELPEADTRDAALIKAGLTPEHWQEEKPKLTTFDKMDEKKKSAAIPAGVRLDTQVPDEECHACELGPTDHSVNLSFPVEGYHGEIGYQKVCLKDWAKYLKSVKEKGEEMAVKTKKETSSAEVSGQLAFETVIKLDINYILPNPYQPEGRIKPPQDVVERIAASIKEHGLLQTPVVRCRPDGKYEMGDGWIRLCGYELLLEASRDKVWQMLPVIIRELTDKQMADLVMEANTIRHDLSPIELAKFYKKYLEDFKITQAELARIHNVSQGEIANTLRLLELPGEIQDKVISHDISETHARYLLQVKDPKEMNRLAKSVVENRTTVAELDRKIKSNLWDKTRPLTSTVLNYGYEIHFDPVCCNDCEHRLMLKSPWGSAKEEPSPRCDNNDCWVEKNNAVQQATHQKEIDDLKAQGIVNFPAKADFKEPLSGWRLKQLDNPTECKTCPKRAAIPDYSGKYEACCIDKECLKTKEKTKAAADKHAQEVEAEKAEKYIEDVFTELPINEKSLQTTIECLLNSTSDTEQILPFVKAFNLFEIKEDEEDEQEYLNDVAMNTIRAKNFDNDTLMRMIARLSFEIFINEGSYGNPDKETVDRLLKSFKAAHMGKPTPAAVAVPIVDPPIYKLKKIGSDWVAENSAGVIIAIGSYKESADRQAKDSYIPISTSIDTDATGVIFILNHTYRISFKGHSFNDVTADNINVAIAAVGKKPEDVTEVKVWKSSGKKSTAGGVGVGWGKCTETIQLALPGDSESGDAN